MPPSQQPVIRRIFRTDRPASSEKYLLVRLDPTPQTSSDKPLELKIVATDQEHLYHGGLGTSELKSLQAKTFRGDLAQWTDILQYALLQKRPSNDTDRVDGNEGVGETLPAFLQDIELVAAISSASATLTIRQNVQGVTQRLGDIVLLEDDEREEVAAFEWVDVAVCAADALRKTLDEERARTITERQRMAEMERQLDELVQAKKTHEELLVGKFAALLNAKKSKIRMLQRLLKGETQDGRDVKEEAEVEKENVGKASGKGSRATKGNARLGRQGPVGPSRGGKRKAKEPPPTENDDNDEEMVDVSVAGVQNAATDDDPDDDDDEDERPVATPDATDDETDDELDLPSRPKYPSNPPEDEDRPMTSIEQDDESGNGKNVKALPPRRELPFTRKAPAVTTRSSRSTGLPPAASISGVVERGQSKSDHHDGSRGGDDDEDDETDDEL